MRLSDLLGADVRTADGAAVGHVNDVRLVQSGPLQGAFAALVVDGLVISHRHTGSLLGYDRSEEQGPWLVATIVKAIHRHSVYVAWTDVEDWDREDRTIGLRPGAELAHLGVAGDPGDPADRGAD